MPTRQRRLNATENAEHLKILNKLQNLGIELETGPLPEPKSRFCLEAIHADFARVHDLPDGSVAVTLPAKLTIYSNVMITDALVVPEWDDCSLDLAEPRDHRYFNQFSEDFPSYSLAILNDLLVGRTHPLERCQCEGLIIAIGWSRVPLTYSDEKLVKFVVRLRDERELDFSSNFVARVDRRLKYKYEKSRPTPESIMERLSRRVPLFQREQVVPTDHVPERARREADQSCEPLDEHRGPIQ